DHETFGWLAYAIERRGQATKGTTATVKSGYDGKQHETRIFGRSTQNFLRRLSWRYLRTLARWHPAEYPHAAAEVIIHYRAEDVHSIHRLTTGFGRHYLLQRVLLGGSKRFTYNDRSMLFRVQHEWVFPGRLQPVPPPKGREEAFPELWDAQPRA